MCVFKYHAFIFEIRPPRWRCKTSTTVSLEWYKHRLYRCMYVAPRQYSSRPAHRRLSTNLPTHSLPLTQIMYLRGVEGTSGVSCWSTGAAVEPHTYMCKDGVCTSVYGTPALFKSSEWNGTSHLLLDHFYIIISLVEESYYGTFFKTACVPSCSSMSTLFLLLLKEL
jgi:hypothetical protein